MTWPLAQQTQAWMDSLKALQAQWSTTAALLVDNYSGGGGIADEGDFINVVGVDGVLDQGS